MDIYVIILAMLFALAVFDLVNGVSNDASNFLNSAVGSRAFGFCLLIGIAAVGIVVGASFSSGMMDIARHGIFSPQYFTFAEIIAICVGVMLTDVVLLDVFNSFGLPTSTTVSMVFELLGGTVSLSLLKLHRGAEGLSLGDLLNTEKALSVILAIFVSVAVAFAFGWAVQWISRALFTFRYKSREKYFIALFGGFSLAAVFYFVLFNGLKGSFLQIPPWVSENRAAVFGLAFAVFAVLSEILFLLRFNVLRLVVGCGTFSLALSFAGNDLVNFIGVPLAGLSAFMAYSGSGLPADRVLMGALCDSERGLWWLLCLSGVVMALALAFSRKTRKVIETSVSLSSQSSSEELFGSSPVARVLVRYADAASSLFSQILPPRLRVNLRNRFDVQHLQLERSDAAFDLLRASVNLMLASVLISVGTSLQLPLSTTYVTFMVAMGSSLADKAWGRESAVYRITGVLTVIGGWFFTAFAAFVCAFLVTSVAYLGGIPAMFLLFALVIVWTVHSARRFRKKEKGADSSVESFRRIMAENRPERILGEVRTHFKKEWGWFLVFAEDSLFGTLKAVLEEDLESLRFIRQKMKEGKKTASRIRHEGFACSRKMTDGDSLAKRFFLYQANDFASSLYYCLERIFKPCLNHVDNHLTPFSSKRKGILLSVAGEVRDLLEDSARMVLGGDYSDFDSLKCRIRKAGAKIVEVRKAALHDSVSVSSPEAESVSLLFLTVLYECRALLDSALYLVKASKKLASDGNVENPGVQSASCGKVSAMHRATSSGAAHSKNA